MATWHARLIEVLSKLCDASAEMHAAVIEQRQAMRSADPIALNAANHRHAEALHAVASLEHERHAAVRDGINANPRLRSADMRGIVPTLPQLAATLAPHERDALLEVASNVRETLGQAQREHAAVGEAAARLDRHMQGITQQARRRVAGPVTYKRGGQYASTAAVAAGLDLTR